MCNSRQTFSTLQCNDLKYFEWYHCLSWLSIWNYICQLKHQYEGSWLDSFYTEHICTINPKTLLQHWALLCDWTILLSLTQSAVLTLEFGVGHQPDNQAPWAGGASVSRPESHQLSSQTTSISRQTWAPDILLFFKVCVILCEAA